MTDNKQNIWKVIEKILLLSVIAFIVIHGIIRNDSLPAVISAICGILYTFFAGKGLPKCYLFGVTGSGFYGFLAYQNALWGNLLLYLCYYIPMQILGYFKWNKNLQKNKQEIVKITLPKKELCILLTVLFFLTFIVFIILTYFKDAHPILDSFTTVFSIGGMYLTVRRAIEQWVFWMGVNALSLAMWINVALGGARVYSTIIMWAVYLLLAIYFYIEWYKEIKNA